MAQGKITGDPKDGNLSNADGQPLEHVDSAVVKSAPEEPGKVNPHLLPGLQGLQSNRENINQPILPINPRNDAMGGDVKLTRDQTATGESNTENERHFSNVREGNKEELNPTLRNEDNRQVNLTQKEDRTVRENERGAEQNQPLPGVDDPNRNNPTAQDVNDKEAMRAPSGLVADRDNLDAGSGRPENLPPRDKRGEHIPELQRLMKAAEDSKEDQQLGDLGVNHPYWGLVNTANEFRRRHGL
jgi:hypothetical protein